MIGAFPTLVPPGKKTRARQQLQEQTHPTLPPSLQEQQQQQNNILKQQPPPKFPDVRASRRSLIEDIQALQREFEEEKGNGNGKNNEYKYISPYSEKPEENIINQIQRNKKKKKEGKSKLSLQSKSISGNEYDNDDDDEDIEDRGLHSSNSNHTSGGSNKKRGRKVLSSKGIKKVNYIGCGRPASPVPIRAAPDAYSKLRRPVMTGSHDSNAVRLYLFVYTRGPLCLYLFV